MKVKGVPVHQCDEVISIQCFKSHKEAFHEGEKDLCDDCYYQTGWKAHIKM